MPELLARRRVERVQRVRVHLRDVRAAIRDGHRAELAAEIHLPRFAEILRERLVAEAAARGVVAIRGPVIATIGPTGPRGRIGWPLFQTLIVARSFWKWRCRFS